MEIDICALQQRNMSIQEFYYIVTDPWDQLALTELNELNVCGAYVAHREEQRLVQFLMALHSDFEGLRSSILHCSPLPSVDLVVSELLVEETRLKSLSEKGIIYTPNPSMFAVPSKSSPNNQNRTSTRAAFDECSFCKHKGHWKAKCLKLRSQNQLRQQSQS